MMKTSDYQNPAPMKYDKGAKWEAAAGLDDRTGVFFITITCPCGHVFTHHNGAVLSTIFLNHACSFKPARPILNQ